jgi:hypothetical protein
MKQLLQILALLTCIVSSSYGMSGDEAYVFNPELALTSILKWVRGFSLSYVSHNSNLLPLPHLPTREEKASKLIGTHRPLAPSIEFEQLPHEIIQYIITKFLDRKEKHVLAGLSKACRNQVWGTITALRISVENITPKNLQDAKGATCVYPLVRTLCVHGKNITPEQIKLLAAAFPDITSLELWDTCLKLDGVTALSQPNTFPELKTLSLGQNALGDESIQALATASFAQNLESLDLTYASITRKGIEALAKTGIFTSLKTLTLSLNEDIGDNEIAILAKTPFANQLKSLNLASTNVKGLTVKILANPKFFTALTSVDLAWNSIGDQGLDALADKLVFLNVKSTDIKAETKQRLLQKQSDKKILVL